MKILFYLLFTISLTVNIFGSSHPYMLVKESDYDSLRVKAEQYPWSAFVDEAEEAINKIVYNDKLKLVPSYNVTSDLASALALCYIIYPENRENYLNVFQTEVYSLINLIRERKENTDIPWDHGYNVGPAQAAFSIYLALDIMYNDLNPDIRRKIEDDVDYIATNHAPNWEESKYAIEGMHALYHDGPQSDLFKEKENTYKEFLIKASSEDGIYTTGPGYVYSRMFMDRRIQKKIFMDICEYQGYNDFYSDPRFINLSEWMLGYSITPFNKTYTFGDTAPVKSIIDWSTAALRINRFSDLAQQYGAWFIDVPNHFNSENTLSKFLLTEKLPVQAKKPESRIFNNGGAWLIGNNPTQFNLSGVLWNLNTEEESHNHYDVNSINITGFGEFLIRNSGYDNWKEPDEETWHWLHRDAESSNTIEINRNNHSSYSGGGVIKGITGYDIEYAEAVSGPAITSGEHLRSLIFIKSTNNLPGYFIIFDEIHCDSSNSVVDVFLHPNSDTDPQIFSENEYRFPIKKCNNLDDDISLSIIINDKPNNATVKEGYRGSYEKCSRYVGKYIDVEYASDENNSVDAGFILFPLLNDSRMPAVNKITREDYNITSLKYNSGIVDYLINPTTTGEIEFDNMKIKASAAFVREVDDNNINVWCRNARMFLNNKIGFESDSNITFLLTGKEGEIISNYSNVRIYFPGITSIKIDNKNFKSDMGNDWVDVQLEKGNHKFVIESDVEIINDVDKDKYYLSSNNAFVHDRFVRIDYSTPKEEKLKIVLYNSDEKKIDTILDKTKSTGTYSIFYDTSNLKSGEYFYEMITSNKIIKKRLTIVK